MSTKKSSNYTGKNIQILKGLEGIRQRFDMYVGGIETASNHLVKEALDNCVDEYINGYSTGVWVEYFEKDNRIIIKDDGRGLPTDIHPEEKVPTIEVLFSNLHAGGKFNKDSFKVSSGKNGIGVKAINALSSFLKVTSTRDGYDYIMEFSKGVKTKDLYKVKSTNKFKSGTTIEFIPDDEILKEYSILNIEDIIENLKVRTYSNAGLKVFFKSGKNKQEFCNPNGIQDYIEEINRSPLIPNIYFDLNDKEGNYYEVVMTYNNTDEELIKSFVNGIATSKGTHETGVKMSVTSVLTNYIKKNNLLPKKLENVEVKGDDVRMGFTCIINIRHIAPSFKGQTKDELSNPEVLGTMKKLTNDFLSEWLEKNPNEAKKICNRIIAFAKGRIEANKYKDKIIKVNSGSSGLSFSNKLKDCTSDNPLERELYVVEGKSAAGSVIGHRISETQACFQLRGKPLNSYNMTNNKLLSNLEFNELIKAIFGTTDIRNIDYDKCRYNKIIILSDADVDGEHIQALMCLFFFHHFKPLIEKGMVYIALTPKYRTTINGKYVYFKNDNELHKFIYENVNKSLSIDNSPYTLKKIIDFSDEYLDKFNELKLRYSISEEFITSMINNRFDLDSIINDFKGDLTYNKKLGTFIGMYESTWHDVSFLSLKKDIEDELYPIANLNKQDTPYISLTDLRTDDEYEADILSVIQYIKDNFKFKLNYFKGLGEADPEEIFETTLNPKKRDFIQLRAENEEEINKTLENLFGNNTEGRKEFVKENLTL